MVFNAATINASSYSNFVSGGSGKIYVPVKPMSVVYAQFDHVSGFAAKNGQSGVSVSRARILNSLIDQLITMKAQPSSNAQLGGRERMSDEQIDAMISQYQSQIQNIVETAKQTPYALAGMMPDVGAGFSISA